MTRQQVADELDWSQSKVIRIEQGTVPVAPSDVMVMLTVYGEPDKERIDELVTLAREARSADTWEEFGVDMSPAFHDLVAMEGVARDIWKYEPSVITGYFQTDDYARALLTTLGHDSGEVEKRARLRAARQQILYLANGPEIYVIMSEVVALRPVGSNEIMRQQLRHLVDLDRRPDINMHLLPLSAGTHANLDQPFTVLQFDEEDLDDLLFLEDAGRRSSAKEDRELIDTHLKLYADLRDMIDNSPSFEERIEKILDDRYRP